LIVDRRRKLTGAGAASIAVMATLAGVPAANAASTCVECGGSVQGGPPPAFLKIVDKFQKEATGVFLKIETAFIKEFKFPGATGGVFQKLKIPPVILKIIGGGSPGVPGNVFLKIK
jgi:hypothetical protein